MTLNINKVKLYNQDKKKIKIKFSQCMESVIGSYFRKDHNCIFYIYSINVILIIKRIESPKLLTKYLH